jgi:hypothetical protein
MSLTDFRNQLRLNPPVLPDLFWLAYNSIARAAANAVTPPFVTKENAQAYYQAWLTELNNYVAANGKFTKFEVAYLPFSPPPLFWDYKCFKCASWIDPNACSLVDGSISRSGWCSVWTPPSTYQAFTWPSELIKGDW